VLHLPAIHSDEAKTSSRIIDLDVDIGADAIDYKYVLSAPSYNCDLPASFSAIANQESLSGLEVEMRKLEGIVKEIVDEMNYLEEREERFAFTNSAHPLVQIDSCKQSY
jgi:p24 family protein delta-1